MTSKNTFVCLVIINDDGVVVVDVVGFIMVVAEGGELLGIASLSFSIPHSLRALKNPQALVNELFTPTFAFLFITEVGIMTHPPPPLPGKFTLADGMSFRIYKIPASHVGTCSDRLKFVNPVAHLHPCTVLSHFHLCDDRDGDDDKHRLQVLLV